MYVAIRIVENNIVALLFLCALYLSKFRNGFHGNFPTKNFHDLTYDYRIKRQKYREQCLNL